MKLRYKAACNALSDSEASLQSDAPGLGTDGPAQVRRPEPFEVQELGRLARPSRYYPRVLPYRTGSAESRPCWPAEMLRWRAHLRGAEPGSGSHVQSSLHIGKHLSEEEVSASRKEDTERGAYDLVGERTTQLNAAVSAHAEIAGVSRLCRRAGGRPGVFLGHLEREAMVACATLP